MDGSEEDQRSGVNRRAFLLTTAAAISGAWLANDTEAEAASAKGLSGTGVLPFYGRHQAGIATPAQDAMCFAALDLAPQSLADIRDLFKTLSSGAANLTQGLPSGGPNSSQKSVPVDTGEAVGLAPANLTVTFGVGRTTFEIDGQDRFGLAHKLPAALQPIPTFKHDRLDASISDGDLCIQACSDDPQVAFHAVHTLTRAVTGSAAIRWLQQGFGRTSSTNKNQVTPRNLMGFKDGTNNVKSDDQQLMSESVWVGNEGPSWLQGGSYLVARRIEMDLGIWDGQILREQERTFGRRKISGAPLTGTTEFDPVALKARGPDGQLVIPGDAHIRLASPTDNNGQYLLRRGYSFADGIDPSTGDMNVGLFFVCFQRDPHKQFVTVQRRLAAGDHLNRYIVHRSNALFAIFPGATSRRAYVGSQLFG